MLEKLKERFHLRGVVSRDLGLGGGNFARSKQVEILSSSYDDILQRRAASISSCWRRVMDEHADQVVKRPPGRASTSSWRSRSLITWELARSRSASAGGTQPDAPRLMVGFNRRFSPAVQRLKQELESSAHRSS